MREARALLLVQSSNEEDGFLNEFIKSFVASNQKSGAAKLSRKCQIGLTAGQ
jgi:hypothetical protein